MPPPTSALRAFSGKFQRPSTSSNLPTAHAERTQAIPRMWLPLQPPAQEGFLTPTLHHPAPHCHSQTILSYPETQVLQFTLPNYNATEPTCPPASLLLLTARCLQGSALAVSIFPLIPSLAHVPITFPHTLSLAKFPLKATNGFHDADFPTGTPHPPCLTPDTASGRSGSLSSPPVSLAAPL